MMANRNILVIVVIYNGMKWLQACLGSLTNSTVDVNVLLIDNGSTDGSPEYIKANFPDFKLLESGVNLGFGRANNIGLEAALQQNCDYVFLLNQDAYLLPDTLERLIKLQMANPGFGILSPLQMNGKGTSLDDNFSQNVTPYQIPIGTVNQPSTGKELYEVHFVMAAMWLMSAECIKRVGLFDGVFTHYGEDNDYLNRVRYHGLKVGVATNCFGFHDREARQVSPVKQLRVRYAGLLAQLTDINHSLFSTTAHVGYFISKMLLKCLIQRNFTLLKANFLNIKELIGKAIDVRKSRTKNAKMYLPVVH